MPEKLYFSLSWCCSWVAPRSQLLHLPPCSYSDNVTCKGLWAEGRTAILQRYWEDTWCLLSWAGFSPKDEDGRISSWVATMLVLLCPSLSRALGTRAAASPLGCLANAQLLDVSGHSQGHQLWVDADAPCHPLGAHPWDQKRSYCPGVSHHASPAGQPSPSLGWARLPG